MGRRCWIAPFGGRKSYHINRNLCQSSTGIQTIADTWHEKHDEGEVYTTVGIHPHDAKTFEGDDTIDVLKKDHFKNQNVSKQLENVDWILIVISLSRSTNHSISSSNPTRVWVENADICTKMRHEDLVKILQEFEGSLPML